MKPLLAYKSLISIGCAAVLASAPLSSLASQWHVGLDNDVVIGDDGDYSNGIAISWQATPQHDFSNASWPFNWQSLLLFPQQSNTSQWGANLYQRMWTPIEIKHDFEQPFDRPYAGLLELESFSGIYGDDFAQKNWFAVGVMGPASGAEATQELVHKLTSSTAPLGWQYQIETEMTFQFAYEADMLLLRQQAFEDSQWELSGHSYTQLGNFRTESNLGLTLRWGDDLNQSFGQISSHAGHYGQYSVSAREGGSWTVFARAQAGYRLNDLSIEGDLPYDSYIQMKHQQASASTGVIWAFPGWSVSWSFDLYSKEYESDPQDWHGYGVISYSWLM
ncbi:DUF2219 domain-containing protein [Shewanella sp. Choline-02u-19]|uniref:lipid A deacylase LpxR family protein n=1 Tax=unclassified Shewanella TaxID=196818 RepID=UPI000C343E41|nr:MULTISPECIES: lipid A deacylase LpxR family protein [unclassified Shewanella]PKG57245.1 DUF2219 domain-containing protein [Shewanella sp. GutDb-MelDb]PKH57442.1 DUF2219 domain-containing protein [Shewanella sp. Bg11-22]PKI28257.1 DUF2219 domain-containing protein [Shewanella sp. Choline-02u-19]